jgi:hypothetical protein
MAVTYKLIQTLSVTGGAGQAAIDFTSIPQTYTDLKLVLSSRNTTAENAVNVSFNGTTSTYTATILFGNGASPASNSPAARTILYSNFSADTASVFANAEVYISGYTSSNQKSFFSETAQENNATTSYQIFLAGLWNGTDAITQLTLTSNSGNLAQFTSASLYGIKNS